jgi:hypothetical protein
LNAIDNVLAKADGTRQDRQYLRPRELPQEPHQRVTRLGEVGCDLPCGLWRAGDGHATQDECRDREVRRDQWRGVECVEVKADVEQLVAEAEEEERSLDGA